MSQNQIPELAQLVSAARVVSLPLRTKFRGLNDREMVLFEGPNGWAEWSPFVEYEAEEAAVWLAAALEFAYGNLPTLNRKSIPVNATCRPLRQIKLPKSWADLVHSRPSRLRSPKKAKQ